MVKRGLALVCLLHLFQIVALAQSPPAAPSSALTNQDIVKLVKAGLGDSIVVSAIQGSSDRQFDMTPSALIALKGAGVSDGVIAAMQGAAGRPTVSASPVLTGASASPDKVVTLVAGTSVKLQLTSTNVSSDKVKAGQALEFAVADELVADGVLVLKRGTSAWGKVTKVTTQRLVRAGVIEFTIDSVKSTSGQDIPLRATHALSGGRGMVTGNEASIAPGTSFEATVDHDVALSSSPPVGATTNAASTSSTTASSGSAPTVHLQAGKLNDGDPAVVETGLPLADATTKIKAYFNGKNIDFTVNADTGRINSDWFNNRRCGPGFQHCESKASVRITEEGSQTLVRIQVFERKREGGLSPKPWNENAKSKSKETTELGLALEAALRK